MIPAEAIEAAAKAIYHPMPIYDEAKEEFTGHRPWEWLTPEYQESLRDDARAALEAAAPHILRTVWDEAYSKGFEAARGERDTPNPYEALK